MPIDPNVLDNPENRCILIDARQPVVMALIALEEAGGEIWWHLVVDLGPGRYAAAQFGSLSLPEDSEEKDFFEQPLLFLVGTQIPEAQVIEREEIGTEAARDLAYESPGRVLVVTERGEFLGILYMGEAAGVSGGGISLDQVYASFRGSTVGGQRKEIDSFEPLGRAEPLLKVDKTARYANAVLMDQRQDRLLDTQAIISPGQVVRLRLDIGELSPESVVSDPEPIPEELLPRDIWLDVMVSSSDFEVASSSEIPAGGSIAHGRFFLPADGSAARTPSGEQFLFFHLRAPGEPGTAYARVGYYYHNHLVQSQLMTAQVGREAGGYRIAFDYTLSYSLRDLEALPTRKQVSVLTNSNGNSHQIVVRPGDRQGNVAGQACAYRLKEEQIGPVVSELREALRSRVAGARQKRRSKQALEADLRRLAPLGRQLWHLTVAQCLREVYPELIKDEKVVIQVSRPTIADYTFPWSLIYDIPLDDDPREWKLCPLVENWNDQDEGSRLVAPDRRSCPEAPNGRHDRNTLCPFGFWGYLYDIEQLSSTDRPALRITIPESEAFEAVAALAQHNLDLDALSVHIQAVNEALQGAFPQGQLQAGKDRTSIQALLGRDTPFVYFFCHGGRDRDSDQDTYLSVGNKEKIRPQDFQDWVQEWLVADGRLVWDKVRPLIFINACHSIEINPRTLVTYLDAFITTGHASGVIGTEVNVRPSVAMDFALQFCRLFFQGMTVGQAFGHIRSDYLSFGNLYGLIYTPYCWSDLKLVTQ